MMAVLMVLIGWRLVLRRDMRGLIVLLVGVPALYVLFVGTGCR